MWAAKDILNLFRDDIILGWLNILPGDWSIRMPRMALLDHETAMRCEVFRMC